MKQMTKEELIEYFIEQLGDNEILGEFMTIEQIRNKLNALIGKVIYSTQPGNTQASWNIHERTLKFDKTKIQWKEENAVIVHELIHILSSSEYVPLMNNDSDYTSYDYTSYKVGIHYFDCIEENNERDFFFDQNRGINEGITDFIAEQISGEKHVGYKEEKSIYNILSTIIGEDIILQKYFANIEPYKTKTPAKARNIFKTELVKKYGVQLGNILNDDVVKVLSLSDQLTDLNYTDGVYGLNENGKRIQNETKQEIYDTLLKVLKNIIDHEQDVDRRANLFRVIGNYYKEDTYEEALSELFEKNNMNYTQKMEILEKIVEIQGHVPFETTRKTLFEMPEAVNMDAKLQLEKLLSLNPLDKRNYDQRDTVYELYIKAGKIGGNIFNKKEIFNHMISNSGNWHTMQDIDNILMGIKYKKVGDNYLVIRENNNGVVYREIYKENGKRVNAIDALRKRDINSSELQYIVGKGIDSNALSNNLKNIMEEYEKSFDESKTRKIGAYFYKDMIMIHNESDLKSELFYTINKDGTLELIEQRRRKKIYR